MSLTDALGNENPSMATKAVRPGGSQITDLKTQVIRLHSFLEFLQPEAKTMGPPKYGPF